MMYLPQLDVIELRVGVDVRVGNADEGPPTAAAAAALRLRRLQRLQHRNQRHIVLRVVVNSLRQVTKFSMMKFDVRPLDSL